MWKELSDNSQLASIKKESHQQPVLIFKHSTRCGLSAMARNRLERNWQAEDYERLKPYILDLISHRDLCRAVSDEFSILHESPQVLIISQGECIYEASHLGIDYRQILEKIAS